MTPSPGHLPPAREVPPNYKWTVTIIVMIGMLMAMIDASIVNVSIPSIMAHFGVNINEVQWVSTSYMIAMAILMPLTAWFRDHLGYRRTYIMSLALFTFGSFLCSVAWSLPTLIIARIIQALGGGAIGPTGLAMITEVFPARERGRAMGVMGIGMILGPALGPTLGGYLTDTFGWRSIFTVNLPIGALAIFLAFQRLIRDEPHAAAKRGFDFWGYAFLTVFLATFLYGFSNGQKDGWTSPLILGCLIVAAVGFSGFLLVETQVKDRIIDIDLFTNPVFATTAVLTAVRSLALFGGMFLLPLFIQNEMEYDALTSGLILLPGSLVMGLVMPVIGRLSEKVGPRYLVLFGLFFTVLSMVMYVWIDVRMSLWALIFPTIVRGFGMSFLMAPLMAAMMNSIPQQKTGMASSITTIIQQVGAAVGVALLSTVLTDRAKHHMNVVGAAVQGASPVFAETMRNLTAHAHSLGLPYAQSTAVGNMALFKHTSLMAMTSAFQDTFLITALIACVTVIPTFYLPKKLVYHLSPDKSKEVQARSEIGID